MSREFRGLATVTRGLQFFCAGLVVLAVALTVSPGTAPWLGILLDFIGRTCCLAVPRKSRCLGLVRASVLCGLITYTLILMPIALSAYSSLIALPIVFIAAPVTVAAQVLFLIAVRRLAEYVGQPRLARAARSILMAGLCFSAFVIGLTFLLPALLDLFPATGPGALVLFSILRISWFAAAA